MDNDVLRRGKPTVHVVFGEAQAMLAGDAMQALAFEVLTPDAGEGAGVPADLQARLVRILARASGQAGMAGGQAIDLASVGQALDEATLRDMHRRKTGALLRASVQMGAACGGLQADCVAWQALTAYGHAMGLAFQIVDDVLDATQPSDTLGKTAGKDADANKPTYVSLLGLDGARQEADALLAQALSALSRSGLADAALQPLSDLAHRIVHRDH
jgi:farnesyl diphosphate synthase